MTGRNERKWEEEEGRRKEGRKETGKTIRRGRGKKRREREEKIVSKE